MSAKEPVAVRVWRNLTSNHKHDPTTTEAWPEFLKAHRSVISSSTRDRTRVGSPVVTRLGLARRDAAAIAVLREVNA
jgi:hypothetical protein